MTVRELQGRGGDHGAREEATNVVERVAQTVRAVDGGAGCAVVALHAPGEADLGVVVRRRADGVAGRVADALRRSPDVAAVRHARQRLLVRLSDTLVAELGAELEAGRCSTLAADGLLRGERYVVDFCDPNATKALHVGHLRNVALGNAFASVLEAAGARVARQSQIADVGHQMGEAMAGYLRHGGGASPGPGRKGDHLVGRCYAEYVGERDGPSDAVHVPDLPVAREMADDDELATSLMRRWQAGDEEVRRLWRTIRDWVTSGHAQTLARLGVRIDRPLLESTYFPSIQPLARSAVERGILTHAPDGALVYETGEPHYPTFPLSRADGFPNQNLRALTTYHELMAELRDVTMLQVCGVEWRAHHVYVERILRRLRPELAVQPTRTILFEMVAEDEAVVSSSAGNAVLIDDLLDELVGREELRALEDAGRPGCAVEDLAVVAALGFCVDRRMTKPMSVTAAAVLDERSAGLALARAWSAACRPEHDGAPAPTPGDPGYRFAVVQSQFHPELVSRALESLDLVVLVRALADLSRWFLRASASPSTARVMRSVLQVGLRDLGLVNRAPAMDAPRAR